MGAAGAQCDWRAQDDRKFNYRQVARGRPPLRLSFYCYGAGLFAFNRYRRGLLCGLMDWPEARDYLNEVYARALLFTRDLGV